MEHMHQINLTEEQFRMLQVIMQELGEIDDMLYGEDAQHATPNMGVIGIIRALADKVGITHTIRDEEIELPDEQLLAFAEADADAKGGDIDDIQAADRFVDGLDTAWGRVKQAAREELDN